MQQLTLFDEPIPPGYTRVPDVGETLEWATCWADGDTSPASLERLAALCVRPDLSQEVWSTTTKELIFFRNIEAHVESDHVVVTSVRFETPAMFRKQHDEQEDEDEEC